MNRTEKETFVREFRSRMENAPVVYLTDFTGLDVKSMTTLRRRLAEAGAEYLVVKNRLAKLALEDLDIPDLSEWLTGPTGVVISEEGAVEPAKAVADFAEEHEDRPVFKIGVLEKAILEPEKIQRLAKLPPRDALLAQLATLMEAPMVALATALEGKLLEVVGLVEALKAQREEES